MALKLDIPVGAAFEKRLAELIWENCPELARQTAAGRIALAIDVTDKLIIKEATSSAIKEAAAKMIEPLIAALRPLMEQDDITSDAAKKAQEIINAKLAAVDNELDDLIKASLNDFVRLYISKKVQPVVADAATGFFNDRPIARRVGEVLDKMIEDHLKDKLEAEKTSRGVLVAAERELIEKVVQ